MPDEPSFANKLIAFIALTGISTSIGIFMKLSLGAAGKFEYSPFAANCLTELYKLVVSLVIVTHLCLQSKKESGRQFLEEVRHFMDSNLSQKLVWHMLGLTLMYVVVNLSVFGVMAYSNASNFFILKASSPVITAIILVGIFSRPVHRAQWISIFAQSVGLVSTQLDLCTGTTAVPWIGYFFIFLNIAVACVAGVWNEHVVKTMSPSVNATNVIMYAFGVFVNIVLFYIPNSSQTLLGNAAAEPPYFLYGFNNWRVIGVVIANGSVGLVITAVYKYADVIVKTFGISGSSVNLYLLETAGLLPSRKDMTGRGPIAFLGAVIVFLAAYLYARPIPKEETNSNSIRTAAPSNNTTTTNSSSKQEAEKEHTNDKTATETNEEDQELFEKEEVDSSSALKKNNNKTVPVVANNNNTNGVSLPLPSAIRNWTRMEWGVLILCFFLGSVLMMSKC